MVAATFQPCSAKYFAEAFPKPELVPVMKTVLPISRSPSLDPVRLSSEPAVLPARLLRKRSAKSSGSYARWASLVTWMVTKQRDDRLTAMALQVDTSTVPATCHPSRREGGGPRKPAAVRKRRATGRI